MPFFVDKILNKSLETLKNHKNKAGSREIHFKSS